MLSIISSKLWGGDGRQLIRAATGIDSLSIQLPPLPHLFVQVINVLGVNSARGLTRCFAGYWWSHCQEAGAHVVLSTHTITVHKKWKVNVQEEEVGSRLEDYPVFTNLKGQVARWLLQITEKQMWCHMTCCVMWPADVWPAMSHDPLAVSHDMLCHVTSHVTWPTSCVTWHAVHIPCLAVGPPGPSTPAPPPPQALWLTCTRATSLSRHCIQHN